MLSLRSVSGCLFAAALASTGCAVPVDSSAEEVGEAEEALIFPANLKVTVSQSVVASFGPLGNQATGVFSIKNIGGTIAHSSTFYGTANWSSVPGSGENVGAHQDIDGVLGDVAPGEERIVQIHCPPMVQFYYKCDYMSLSASTPSELPFSLGDNAASIVVPWP